jgi:hypothetical protein
VSGVDHVRLDLQAFEREPTHECEREEAVVTASDQAPFMFARRERAR